MTKGEEQSFEELEDEMVEFLDESDAKGKGLWHNIREKKRRMGKNYRPAKPGDKDYPDPKALKKAQGPKKKKSKAEDEKEDKKGKDIRIFDVDKDESEYVWHRDNEDRMIEVLSGDGWQFQPEGSLPILLKPGIGFTIRKGEYHRLLKGINNLEVRVTRLL